MEWLTLHGTIPEAVVVPCVLDALLEEPDPIDEQIRERGRKQIEERDEFEALEAAIGDLIRLDRYQRRAWSKQKRAIREFIRMKTTASDVHPSSVVEERDPINREAQPLCRTKTTGAGLQPDLAERSQTQEGPVRFGRTKPTQEGSFKFGRTKPTAGGLHIIRLNEAKRAGQSRTCLAERTHHCWRFKSTVLNLVDHLRRAADCCGVDLVIHRRSWVFSGRPEIGRRKVHRREWRWPRCTFAKAGCHLLVATPITKRTQFHRDCST